jgi:hypothetical protein
MASDLSQKKRKENPTVPFLSEDPISAAGT